MSEALASQITSISLAWEIARAYVLSPTPENFKQFIHIHEIYQNPWCICRQIYAIQIIAYESYDLTQLTFFERHSYQFTLRLLAQIGSIYRWKQTILVPNFSLVSVSSQCFLKSHHLSIILSVLS